jgi:alkylated DNA nucleotide flippase Atl1
MTTAVLWLNEQGLNVRCVTANLYSLNGGHYLDLNQVIPLPAASDYIVKIREKEKAEQATQRVQRRRKTLRVLLEEGIITPGDRVELFRDPRPGLLGRITEERAKHATYVGGDDFRWEYDGQLYSLSALCQRLCDAFGGDQVPGSFAGPVYWRLEDDEVSLAERASKGVRGFDWGLIDTAIAAIPAGKWTTYGELAKLGGTGAVAVGQHVANDPGLTNAYRVLGSDGRPRPDFRWTDPAEDRSVIDVLRSEGVALSEDGKANWAQRLDAADLRLLISGASADASGTKEEALPRLG